MNRCYAYVNNDEKKYEAQYEFVGCYLEDHIIIIYSIMDKK